MYKALKLYPLTPGQQSEYMYHTKSVNARLKTLTRHEVIAHTWRGRGFNLQAYLDLAAKYEWDITRDVNYAYATVKYTPADIKKRLRRLFGAACSYTKSCKLLAEMIGCYYHQLYCAGIYHYSRTAKGYARLMLGIMTLERRRGYPDALDFEE